MSEPETPPPTPDQLMEEAAAWFARMRGPEADLSREAFEAWLRRGALHRRAYNRAAEIFAMGKLLADETPRSNLRRDRQRRIVLAAVAVLLALAAFSWLALRAAAWTDAPDTRTAGASGQAEAAELIATSAGETRLVRLADGSRLRLGQDSAIEVRLGPSGRRLELARGLVRFEVFHDARPFVVHAGGGRITARGTVFEVGLGPDRRVTVRLIEGIVDVTLPVAPGAGRPGARRLRPGETLSFDARAEAAPEASGAGVRATASEPRPTSERARDFRAVTVAELVAAANRGSPHPIRLADPATGERRVSGRFRIDDTALLAERLAILFDLAIERRRPGDIVLRSR